jgi:hypothetical protein
MRMSGFNISKGRWLSLGKRPSVAANSYKSQGKKYKSLSLCLISQTNKFYKKTNKLKS